MYKEMRTSPESLDLTAFAFKEGDYVLIHWRNGGPHAKRIWDQHNVEELYKLIPSLKDRVERGFPIFPPAEMEQTDPMWDIRNRLRGLL